MSSLFSEMMDEASAKDARIAELEARVRQLETELAWQQQGQPEQQKPEPAITDEDRWRWFQDWVTG